ncbi:MAG: DinB family protein [Anaerolineales bacterium]|nr:DinB family protein [Anaerolineales bacterium]
MNLPFFIAQLQTQGNAIIQLVGGLTPAQARWRPKPSDWSVLEVLNHLIDEEREDFPARLRVVLSGTAARWSPIAPQAWVKQRRYNQRDLAESIAAFRAERAGSLKWLRALPARTPWRRPYAHGDLTAGDLLTAWTAHDVLHLRQLNELRYALITRTGRPFSPVYAGDW